jgi:hypothetical protein
MKTRPVIILAIVAAVVIGAAVWFLQSTPQVAPLAPSGTPVAVSATPAPEKMAPITGTPIAKGAHPTPSVAAGKPAATPPPLADWEIKIDQVLRANANETETAQMLINLLPTLPMEGQTEAAQHIANLIVDKDYGKIMPLLKNASLPQEVQDVFVTDLMNREDPVKLPALLEVAKIPNHPYHEEALTDLQIFLDQDNGNNWAKWDSATKEYLKKQAAENTDANSTAPAQ